MTMDNMFTADCKDCKDPHFCFYEGYCINDEADTKAEIPKGNNLDREKHQPQTPSVGEASAQRIIDNLHGILHKIAWSK